MITSADLDSLNGQRPFAPYWIRLSSGERICITERNRAVAQPREFVCTIDGQTLRRIPLEDVCECGLLTDWGQLQREMHFQA